MIFSDLNAHWHILSCTLFISLLSLRWRPSWSWIKAAVEATEKAAELPRPAPMGISDVTVISIEGTWSPASLKIATRKKKYVHVQKKKVFFFKNWYFFSKKKLAFFFSKKNDYLPIRYMRATSPSLCTKCSSGQWSQTIWTNLFRRISSMQGLLRS